MPASASACDTPLATTSRLEIGSPGEETDPSMAEIDEVSRGLHATFEVLRVDSREVRCPDVRVDGDDRMGLAHLDDGRRDEDRAVGERSAQAGEVPPLPARSPCMPPVHDES